MEPIVNKEGLVMLQDAKLGRALLNAFYKRQGYKVRSANNVTTKPVFNTRPATNTKPK